MIYGTNHSTAGDNLRYVYDFASGRFRLAFRVEGNVELLPQNPNLTLFDQTIEKSSGYPINKIFTSIFPKHHQGVRLIFVLDSCISEF